MRPFFIKVLNMLSCKKLKILKNLKAGKTFVMCAPNKNMYMKKLLLATAIFALSATVNAQEKVKVKSGGGAGIGSTSFSIGLEGAIPMGNFNDEGYKVGIGGSVEADHQVASGLAVTLNAGYINFRNHLTTYSSHFTTIPVLAGIKFWFSPKVYGSAQLGAAFNSFKASNTNGVSYSSTGFAYSPGVGFMLSRNIDFLVKYFGNSINNGSSISYQRSSIGARLAYRF